MSKVALGVLAGFVVLVGVLAFTYFSMKVKYINQEVDLRENIASQTTKNKNRFDAQFKIILGKAQVSEKYADQFKEIYIGIMTAKYGENGKQEGGMMNVIRESNPTFDNSMLKDLMETIEVQKLSFEREQNTLIALGQEHNKLLHKFPSSFFLSDVKPIDIVIVTSSKTKNAFETGEDNDTDIFEKKK